jgi:hypothetical protein
VNRLDYLVLIATILAIPLYGLWRTRGSASLRSVHEYALSLDPSQNIGRLSIKDVSFDVPVDTSLDTSRFRRDIGGSSE